MKPMWLIIALVVLTVLLLLTGVLVQSFSSSDGPLREEDFTRMREKMVSATIENRGVSDKRVLAAMRAVPRHRFVPNKSRPYAYLDNALPIGHGQTISQPYIVAAMTELLDPDPGETMLEIGTGSGYQAAVLARLIKHVYSVEIVPELAERARETLEREEIRNVTVKSGDGYKGWPEHAPFDAIIVTCAPENVPQPLVEQLKDGGRLVIPVGPTGGDQRLYLMQKKGEKIVRKEVFAVRFVPLTRLPSE